MPLREYECPKHPGVFEFLEPPDEPPYYCRVRKCGAELIRIPSVVGCVEGGVTQKFYPG